MSTGAEMELTPRVSSDVEATPEDSEGNDALLTSCQAKRRDFIRLLVQSLSHLGFEKSAKHLEEESGIGLYEPPLQAFRAAVLNGDWGKIDEVLPGIQTTCESDLKSVKFFVYEQIYLELLEAGQKQDALKCLRMHLSPLAVNSGSVHRLSSLVVCRSAEELRQKASWGGATRASRMKLLEKLQPHVSSKMLIPEGRLEQLVSQALQMQVNNCLFHNTTHNTDGLLYDHVCSRDRIPRETLHVLESHSDEVWFVQFSPTGKHLASASKDSNAIIWAVDNLAEPFHVLVGHTQALSFLSWNHSGTQLLTCGNDKTVRLWDVASGDCLHVFQHHTDAVTACAWLPGDNEFVSGGLDKSMVLWKTDGTIQYTWRGARINDLSITSDGTRMVACCSENRIRLYDLVQPSKDCVCIQESEAITSLCLSKDGRFLLVNIALQDIHLWDLETQTIVQKYRGHRQSRFVIRSAFGGADQAFVISGSEDSEVHIWHRRTGNLLEALPGHSGTVNSVSWSPTNAFLFASASDDHTVRVWTTPSEGKPQAE